MKKIAIFLLFLLASLPALGVTAEAQGGAYQYLQPPYQRYKQQDSAPAATKTGYNLLYAKSTGFFFKIDGGSEVQLRDSASPATFGLGTITTDKKVFDGSATWNAGGVTFTGIKLNVTDTASAAGSLLFDLQKGGTSLFNVGKSGTITSALGTIAASTPALSSTATWNSGGVTFTHIFANITDTASASGSLLADLQVGGSSKFSVTKAGNVSAAGTLNVTGAATFTAGAQSAAVAITVTADGLTTGTVPAGTRFVSVTSDNADKIMTLPAPVVGNIIEGYVGATGFEIRTVAASDVKINNVDADGTQEAAIPATTYFKLICVSATEWILLAWDELGAPIAAIVPD